MTLSGQDLMVFVKNGAGYSSIAYATSHTLDVSMDQIDSSTKDNGVGYWQNSEPGLMSWTMSTENLMSDTAEHGYSYNDLFEIMLKRETVDVVFSLQTNNIDYASKLDQEFEVPETGWTPDTDNNYHGKAYITSLSVSATNGEKASYSATFTGAGALLKAGKGVEKKK